MGFGGESARRDTRSKMPIYIFHNQKTDQYKEIVMSMNDKHEYIDENGFKWDRIFTCPKMSIDTEINPFSEKEFNDKFANKKGTVGDLWDKSEELSEKRKKSAGRDEIKEKTISTYEKHTHGIKHPFRHKPDKIEIEYKKKK